MGHDTLDLRNDILKSILVLPTSYLPGHDQTQLFARFGGTYASITYKLWPPQEAAPPEVPLP
jgi:hypothetical protein